MKYRYEITLMNFRKTTVKHKCCDIKIIPKNTIVYYYDGRLNDEELYEVNFHNDGDSIYYYKKEDVVLITKL